jgi:carbonic anhydrase
MRKVAALLLLTSFVVNTQANAETLTTPDAVLTRLKQGNDRYLTGVSEHRRIDVERRVETAKLGQKPLSTILGCSDSRVPVEVVFDQGFAEVFVVRVAGNVCDTAGLASVEYGVAYLGTPLIVVLGHSKCGAVDGAVSGAQLDGSLPKLMKMIEPAVAEARQEHPKAAHDELLDAAIEKNVFLTMKTLILDSPVLRKRMKNGQLQMVGAVRDLKSGKVTWLGRHPQEGELLKSAPQS